MASRPKKQKITMDVVPIDEEEEDESDDEDDGEAGDNLFKVPTLKRKLLADFSRPSVASSLFAADSMKVFLRIRPFTKQEIDSHEDQGCLTVESDTTVSTHAPKDSNQSRNSKHTQTKTNMKYSFSQIFNENTTQKSFFNSTMLGMVKEFIEGQNCLVFTYGVTSSGKTYTIQGNPKDAGVLPRALDVLFNSISGRQYEGMNLKPVLFTNVEKLTPEQEMVERRIKESVMKLSSDDDIDMISMLGDDASVSLINSTISSEGSNISSLNSRFSDQSRASTSSAMDGKESLGSSEHLFDLLGERVREEAKVNVGGQDQIQYSVWVSFAEIYNEQIFDLLVPVSNKKNARRPCLKLSEDQSGSPYIKGLKLIHVANADEAYKLLTIGQRNLQKACTKLNQNSSRSHCIFNIKVLQVVDAENPHVSRISMLSLCDLAGSERYGKTKASGARLREAGNINTSLLTLGRCIATLRYNQANKDHTKIVPFRESKLTRLFQNFFVGHGKAAMIVNINQCASMFDETHHVFKFSAVASQVIMQPKPVFIQPKMPVSAPIPRASISWAAPCTPSKVKPAVSEVCPLPGEDEDEDLEDDEDEVPQQLYTRKDIEELLLLIESLQAQLVDEQKSKDRLESEIRRELCDEMAEQFRLMEEHCSEQIRMREESVEEMYEKRLELVQNAERARRQNLETKKDDDDEWVSSVLLHQEQVKVQRRDEKITTLKDELSEIKDQLRVQNVAKEELQARNTEHETELAQLRSHICTSTDTSEKDIHIQELEDKIKSLQETVDALKQTLAQKPEEKEEDNSQANLVENLTIQLQKAQDQIKEQSQEMSELNEMLTEAGETFTQKESEIQKLKDLTQEYEAKMLKQSDAIQALQQGIADSREALSSADKTMSNSEEKVSSLHQDLQQLKGEVKKYKNKARFFEEQVVEREQECQLWRTKYEQCSEEHSKSEEALIHGFKAEISNLRSQLFSFKTQLLHAKSPHKSPGSTLKGNNLAESTVKSPLAKVSLFKDVVSETEKSTDLDNLVSPVKSCHQHSSINQDVSKQLQELQAEMDKNCKMIAELEHALQAAKATSEKLESKLEAECAEHAKAVNKIKEQDEVVKKLNEKIEMLRQEMEETEEKKEELSILNEGLKDIVNKTTYEIQQKENEIQCLSPKKTNIPDKKTARELKTEISNKVKEVNKLKKNLSKAEKKLFAKETKLTEVTEMCTEFEFRVNERDFENQEQKKAIDAHLKTIDSLQCSLNAKTDELCKTGEELALLQVESTKLNRQLSELKSVRETEVEKLKQIDNKSVTLVVEKRDVDVQTVTDVTDGKVEELEKYAEKAEQEKKDLESKLHSVMDEKDKIAAGLNLAENHASELQKQLSGMSEWMEKTEIERNAKIELEATLANIKTEACKMKEQLAEKDEEINMFSQNLSAILEEQEQLQAAWDKKSEEAQQHLQQREEQISTLNQDLNSLREEHDQLQASVDEWNRKALETTQELQEKELLINKLTNDIELTKRKVACMDEDNEKMISQQEMIIRLESQVEELRQKLESDTSKYDQINEMVTSVMELESAVADKEMELCKKEKMIEEKTKEIENLQTEMGILRECLTKAEEKVSSAEKEVEFKLSEIKTLEEGIHNLKHLKLEENKAEIEEREQEINELKQELKDLKKHNEDLIENKADIEEREQEINELKQELKDLKKHNEDLIERFEERRSELEAEKAALSSQVSELTDDLDKSEEKVSELEKKIQVLNDELDMKTAELNSNLGELSTAKDNFRTSLEKVHHLEDEVDEKCKEIDQLRNSIDELQMKLVSDQDEESKLRDALEEIEELKTTVRTQETQYKQVKEDEDSKLSKALSEIEDLKTSIKSQESQYKKIEEDKNSKLSEALAEIEELKTTIKTLETQCKKVKENENSNLSEALAEIEELRNTIKCHETQSKKVKEDERSSLSEALAEIEGLKTSIKTWETQYNKVKEDLDGALLEVEKCKSELTLNHKGKETQYQSVKRELEEALLEIQNRREELQSTVQTHENEYQNVKTKLEEALSEVAKCKREIEHLKECQSNTVIPESPVKGKAEKDSLQSEGNHLSPQTGVRRLRKEKIEIQNTLIAANFKIETLEKEVSELKSKLTLTAESSIPAPRELEAMEQESVLQRKLTHLTLKLKETETSNRTLIKEVSDLQSIVEQLERERGGNGSSPRKSRVSLLQSDPRRSICSPVSKVELTRSQEREQCLQEQLTTSRQTIQEWLTKFAEVEAELVQRGQELSQAQETITNLKKQYNVEKEKLEEELRCVSERNRSLELTKITLEGEIEASTTLMEDLSAQMDKVTAERDKYKTDYSQLMRQHNSLPKPLESKADIQRLLRLEEERDSLKARVQTLTSEKATLESVLRENNAELKEMEKSLTVARQDVEEFKSKGGKHAHSKELEELRRKNDKTLHDLNNKMHHIQSEKKELEYKLKLVEGKLEEAEETKHGAEKKLQDFRAERDKLVSGLEAVLEKKDADIKKHKDIIRQLKEREIHLAQTQTMRSPPPATPVHENTDPVSQGTTPLPPARRGRKRKSPQKPEDTPHKEEATIRTRSMRSRKGKETQF